MQFGVNNTKYLFYILKLHILFMLNIAYSIHLSDNGTHVTENLVYEPLGPLVLCRFLPLQFIECDDPEDFKGNKTARDEAGYGCLKFGSQKYQDVEKTSVKCQVLDNIECFGNRTFFKPGVPCVKYGNYYYLSTLLYSILLGFSGIDRFSLGQTGTAVGKLLTLSGFGIWWIVDVVLILTNGLSPEDGSNWNTYI